MDRFEYFLRWLSVQITHELSKLGLDSFIFEHRITLIVICLVFFGAITFAWGYINGKPN